MSGANEGKTKPNLGGKAAPHWTSPGAAVELGLLRGQREGAEGRRARGEGRVPLELHPGGPRAGLHRALARWESFSLDYHVEPPVAELINADAMARYRKMFTFLWKLKRVEHALTSTWRKHGTAAHTLGSKCRLPCFTTAPHRPA